MTFESWLKLQKNRDDAVGDLSKDFFDAKKIDMAKGISNKFQKCDKEHLDRWHAIPDAYKALKQAKREYSAYIKLLECNLNKA